jgi:hypothetical protein
LKKEITDQKQELIDKMGGKKFYTSLDINSAFHQITMKTEDFPKTAFICHHGIFEFTKEFDK